MAEKNSSSNNMTDRSIEAWRQSRSGAWASRGFHYQHLVSTLILVRQWADLAPPGYLVPEGLQDCVVELTGRHIWIQAKSRADGTFRTAEIQGLLDAVDEKAAPFSSMTNIESAVVLEQPDPSTNAVGIGGLFEPGARKVIVCEAPLDELTDVLLEQLETAPVIVEGLVSDLYKLVADASAANASLSFDERRQISTTEVERRIFERLEAEDSEAIDRAVASGVVEPVDFVTPVDEPGFYQGVRVRPGHVAAGLVLERPSDTRDVIATLKRQRHVLVCGPSGAGKSALMWLSAQTLAGDMRWFRITGIATLADAEAIVRFVRARRPTAASQIGIAFDDIGSANNDLWNILVHELRGLPAVYLLGSVREEDVPLIANHSDTAFIPVKLDDALAKMFWETLAAKGETKCRHWREPFEQTNGLMLEYIHVLTQGERLATVIREQVRQREDENRNEELAIIRSAAVLFAHGGEIEAASLYKLLGLSRDAASIAMTRLLDEHLILESRPGVLGGLHLLRSQALLAASHDGAAYRTTDTLWQSLPATTLKSLPRVVRSILADVEGEESDEALRRLAGILDSSHETDLWAAILTGLGLATLERHVVSFISLLEQHDVQPAQWPAASLFASSGIEVPDWSTPKHWQKLRNAVLAFRALSKVDLRPACLEQVTQRHGELRCCSVPQANHLLSCCVPICGGKPVPVPFATDFPTSDEPNVHQVAALLSTAYLVDPQQARRLVTSLGGQQALFDLFRSQTPWVTSPSIQPGSHGVTVRADWFHVAEHHQPDPHDAVCQICGTLIALTPDAAAAASDALSAMGETIVIGDITPYSKNMPRENLPPKVAVAWNIAFCNIFRARATAADVTDYANEMAPLLQSTEAIFRAFTEKWIKGKEISQADSSVVQAMEVSEAVRSLVNPTASEPPTVMTESVDGPVPADDLGSLITGILNNLLTRVGDVANAKSAAVFAGSLAAQALKHRESDVWRTVSSPPLDELELLADRLEDVACILHEMAHDPTDPTIRGILKFAGKANIGKATTVTARRCRIRADRRFENKVRDLVRAFRRRGWDVRSVSRCRDEEDSVYWPDREVAILVDVMDLERQWIRFATDSFSIAQPLLENAWPFRIVPVVNDNVLGSLALRPSSSLMWLPDEEFLQNWSPHVDRSFLVSDAERVLRDGIQECIQISSILRCRDIQDLHPKEERVLSLVTDAIRRRRIAVAEKVGRTEFEQWHLVREYLEESWSRVHDELNGVRRGRPMENVLCEEHPLVLTSEENQQVQEFARVRLAILQAECDGRTEANSFGA